MQNASSESIPRTIAVSGATGLVGTALVEALKADGREVCPIVRSAKGIPGEILWDTTSQTFDAEALAACDAVVHLAGENIVGRWTPQRKRTVRDSRVNSTQALAQTIASLPQGPRIFIAASAIGYYGDTGQTPARTEDDPPGSDYLAKVCVDWEAATSPARDAGIRTVNLRIGIVLSKDGGALAKMLTPFRLGLGGRIGKGDQWMSWIALNDMVRIITHALDTPAMAGPYNAAAPNPVMQSQFAQALGKALRRPTIIPLPAFVPRILLGKEAADALVLGSIRVEPRRLAESGYAFVHSDLESALHSTFS